MPMSALEFSRAFQQMAKTVKVERRAALAQSGLIAKREIEKTRNKAVGSDGRMSGVGNAKLGVRYDVGESSTFVRATGPWQLIERDTKPAGLIVGKTRSAKTGKYRRTLSRGTSEKTKLKRYLKRLSYSTGRASFSNVRPLSLPWGPRAKVYDKGTKGKRPFQKGLDVAEPRIVAELQTSTRSAVRGVFGR